MRLISLQHQEALCVDRCPYRLLCSLALLLGAYKANGSYRTQRQMMSLRLMRETKRPTRSLSEPAS